MEKLNYSEMYLLPKEIYDKIMINIQSKEDILPHLVNHKNVFYKLKENQENGYNENPVMNVINNQEQNPWNYNHTLNSSSTSSNQSSNNFRGDNNDNSDISMYNLSENLNNENNLNDWGYNNRDDYEKWILRKNSQFHQKLLIIVI